MRACHPHSEIRNPKSLPHSGFTLVELLIAIAIIGVLAALLLGVAAQAGERAREARTRALIARIHPLVMEHYDTYRDRRAPLNPQVEQQIEQNVAPGMRGRALAEARLYAKRELMLLEMPDRWSDVILAAVGTGSSQPMYLRPTRGGVHGGPTPLNEAYRRQYFSMVNAGVSAEDIKRYQGAECLYMIVMMATADGEARSMFNESDIGDTDGDGAPEFLDGWGNPIDFFRWAPGVVSDLQQSALELGDPTSSPWINAAAEDHDPVDMFRIEPRAFRLVPYIYSAGSDERYSMFTAQDAVTWRNNGWPTSPLLGTPILSPFHAYDDPLGALYIGTPLNASQTAVDPGAVADNINNHNISTN